MRILCDKEKISCSNGLVPYYSAYVADDLGKWKEAAAYYQTASRSPGAP
jgi:hypothetical protein